MCVYVSCLYVSHVSHVCSMFLCVWLVREQVCVSVSDRQRKRVCVCIYVYIYVYVYIHTNI